MGLFNRKPEINKKIEEQKSLTEKLVDKKGTAPKKDTFTKEEQTLKCKTNKRRIRNKTAQLTKKGRYAAVVKADELRKSKKRRKKLKLNLNRKHPDRKTRDKIRDIRKKTRIKILNNEMG